MSVHAAYAFEMRVVGDHFERFGSFGMGLFANSIDPLVTGVVVA